jgi:diguanylate cyclase (GGDEF)-like protein
VYALMGLSRHVSEYMSGADTPGVDDPSAPRQHVARILEQHTSRIVNDAVAVFPFAITGAAGSEVALRVGQVVLQLVLKAVRDGDVDTRSSDMSDLCRIGRDHRLAIPQLFELVYLVERAALDELAVDESFGAASEPWPAVARMVRRASFRLLAAFTERVSDEAGGSALTDSLTTLHTRPVLMAALEKELQRSERFAHPFALILFDVDWMTRINEQYGYGVGDRVLERIGIVLRNYFREQDWVSRCAGDRFAVLLPETAEEPASQLADHMRVTVQDRFSLPDYKSEAPMTVTVSVAVLIATAVDATVKAEQVVRDAEQAVHRAKHGGRNRVERVEINVTATAPPLRDAHFTS